MEEIERLKKLRGKTTRRSKKLGNYLKELNLPVAAAPLPADSPPSENVAETKTETETAKKTAEPEKPKTNESKPKKK